MSHDWKIIFEDTAWHVAKVIVYDKGEQSSIGRYTVSKLMKLADGKTRHKQSYYFQRAAAINYAKKWIARRVEMMRQGPPAPMGNVEAAA